MEKSIDIKNNKLYFNNNNVKIIIDNENNPWFQGKDVCNILGYINSKNALFKKVSSKYKKNLSEIGGMQNEYHPNHNENRVIFISEPGLYELIFSCNLPIAKDFKYWVFEEVLPSIRKYGEYKIQENIVHVYEDKIEIKNDYIKKLTHTTELAIKVLNKRNDEINNIKPKVVIDTKDKSLLNIFCIIQISSNEFYVIRCQRRSFTYRLNKLKKKCTDLSILIKLNYNPNSINLYNRIKESLEIEFNGNRFINEKYTNEELINKINNLI